MPRRDHAAICALTQLFDVLVFGVNDEGGVEGGETMSLHLGGIGLIGGGVYRALVRLKVDFRQELRGVEMDIVVDQIRERTAIALDETGQ